MSLTTASSTSNELSPSTSSGNYFAKGGHNGGENKIVSKFNKKSTTNFGLPAHRRTLTVALGASLKNKLVKTKTHVEKRLVEGYNMTPKTGLHSSSNFRSNGKIYVRV